MSSSPPTSNISPRKWWQSSWHSREASWHKLGGMCVPRAVTYSSIPIVIKIGRCLYSWGAYFVWVPILRYVDISSTPTHSNFYTQFNNIVSI